MASLPSGLRRLRIVVTDDDPAMLAHLIGSLKSAGHVAFAAYDGRSACELAEYLQELDLVITNTRLLNMDAPALIQRVRNAKPWLAILHLGDPLPQEGPLLGVPTLREPFTSEQLFAAIASTLAQRIGSGNGAGRLDEFDGALPNPNGGHLRHGRKHA
jgi:DNA-binding response OmpR family regulator